MRFKKKICSPTASSCPIRGYQWQILNFFKYSWRYLNLNTKLTPRCITQHRVNLKDLNKDILKIMHLMLFDNNEHLW